MSKQTYPQHPSSVYEPSGKKQQLHQPFRMGDAWERVMVAQNKFRIHVLTPLGAILKDAYKTYPALTSYLMVLTGLSVIPIIAFVGFSMFVGSILAGMGLAFVLTWGSIIIGSAFFVLMMSLAFLVAAAFWIVIGLFVTIFALRLVYNVQSKFVHKVKHSQVVKELVNHANEKRLHHQQNGIDENVKSA
ncbi:hypothetical protein MJO28_004124 [Puccinia striiformis f. sp. tritici]|uniref:Uncharacterized protein n=2 Tax=Puccinia striiformis f. sp. tritici TaxID=168172 RepID=A0ACC0EQD1_9BASI|nr:hypothetical protein Pst134EA_007261 [Puccinia striiformis f. sp. tritici]KAH9469994.1 hypothetical protein Pst134EA_007261 [Puccinia striiformis f. sp. tritici]KAI7957029.1 hypothetical protein MJO28_004124 [Puccinia striiformis f. sp. tritici]KAI7963734.1 hypothetical protein MJO29_004161 [Puccinia striiformis f. sp. tritici]KAI9617074.1 hypothetical protein H4Q26_010712 [Puccinia striiformis f. sp. tritici PST-130]